MRYRLKYINNYGIECEVEANTYQEIRYQRDLLSDGEADNSIIVKVEES